MMISKVIAGEYKGARVYSGALNLYIYSGTNILNKRKVKFNRKNVKSWEILDILNTNDGSGVGRAIAGGLLFGGVGAIVGATTKQNTQDIKVGIEFLDNKKSILSLDANLFKSLKTSLRDLEKLDDKSAEFLK